METGTKVLIGIGVGAVIGGILYFSLKGKGNKSQLVIDIMTQAEKINGTPIPKARKDEQVANLNKMSEVELSKLATIFKKAEKNWTKDETSQFVELAKKYNLKIGG